MVWHTGNMGSKGDGAGKMGHCHFMEEWGSDLDSLGEDVHGSSPQEMETLLSGRRHASCSSTRRGTS